VPKTIDQIHKEAQAEDQQKSIMVEQYNMQQKQGGGGGGGGRGPRGRDQRPMPGFGTPNANANDDGWQSVGKNSRNANSIDPGRMRITKVCGQLSYHGEKTNLK
jgi:hypothetical protein